MALLRPRIREVDVQPREGRGGEAPEDEGLSIQALDADVREPRPLGAYARDRGVLGLDLEAEVVARGVSRGRVEEEAALADADLHLDGGRPSEERREVDETGVLGLAGEEDPRVRDPSEIPRAGARRPRRHGRSGAPERAADRR